MAQNSAENLEKIYKNSVEKLQQSLKSTELTGAILNLIYYNDLAALNVKFNKFNTASTYCRRATTLIPQLNNEGKKILHKIFSYFVGFTYTTIFIITLSEVEILMYASDSIFILDLGRHAELLSQLLYNHGLVLLSLKQPTLAHSCLHLSALFQQHITNRPRFWIRLAECCITQYLLLVRT